MGPFSNDRDSPAMTTKPLLGDWRVMTVGTTMKNLGHAGRTLDYLKIDVGGAEWDWLDVEDVEVLQHVQQLAMTVNLLDLQTEPTVVEMLTEAAQWYYDLLEVLQDAGLCLVSVREASFDAGQRLKPGMDEEKATVFEALWVQR